MNKLSKETLYLLIADAEKRIMSNSEDKAYVKKQKDFIKKCEEAIERLCPICKEKPLLEEGANALSRKDNKTEICDECGIKEAMEELGL